MKNWKRTYRLVAGLAGQSGFEIGEETDQGRALHIKFDLEKTDVSSNNTGTISIWNLNDEHVSVLEQKDCMIALYAGYGDTKPLIFSGNVTNPETAMESTDRKTDLDVVDGRGAIRDTYLSLSYVGETLLQTIYGDCINQMGITCIYSQGAAVLLAATKLPLGYAFIGTAADCLTQLCNAYGLKWSIQNGVCQVLLAAEPISQQAYLLSEETGLIGVPKRVAMSAESTVQGSSDSKTVYGYEVEYFLNGAINVNDLVQLQSAKVSGYFRVKNIQISGDNLEGDWTCTAKMVEVSG